MTPLLAKTSLRLRLVGACAFVLLVAAGGGAAPAYGGWHHGGNNGGGPFGTGPVHGPGSSHNPIVHHPVPGPAANLRPVVTSGPVVRDHRRPPSHHGPNRASYCRHHWSAPECAHEVRDHRTSLLPTLAQWSPL